MLFGIDKGDADDADPARPYIAPPSPRRNPRQTDREQGVLLTHDD